MKVCLWDFVAPRLWMDAFDKTLEQEFPGSQQRPTNMRRELDRSIATIPMTGTTTCKCGCGAIAFSLEGEPVASFETGGVQAIASARFVDTKGGYEHGVRFPDPDGRRNGHGVRVWVTGRCTTTYLLPSHPIFLHRSQSYVVAPSPLTPRIGK